MTKSEVIGYLVTGILVALIFFSMPTLVGSESVWDKIFIDWVWLCNLTEIGLLMSWWAKEIITHIHNEIITILVSSPKKEQYSSSDRLRVLRWITHGMVTPKYFMPTVLVLLLWENSEEEIFSEVNNLGKLSWNRILAFKWADKICLLVGSQTKLPVSTWFGFIWLLSEEY